MRRMLMLMIAACSVMLIGRQAQAHPCAPGDLDFSGVVDINDLLDLLGQWGPCPDQPCAADLTCDGTVGVEDLLTLLANWGPTPFDGGALPGMWINGGPGCGLEPAIQVHQYNDTTYILRQSLCTHFEAPFMYLLFGTEQAMLLDTGAGGIALADTVYTLIDLWLAEHDQESIELLVAHSHGHSDHLAGDNQFIDQPNTTLVPNQIGAIWNFFGFTDWPDEIVQYDLGGRVLDVIPIPGHHPFHIAFYDRNTGLLLSGDTLYPGRLYIASFGQYVESIERLIDFVNANEVCQFLGGHIEMSNTPGVDFPIGATYHPDEHELPMYSEHLFELHAALLKMQAKPYIETHDEFIIWPW